MAAAHLHGRYRVLLTHGPGIDQPLSVIRMNYVQEESLDWPNFAVIPIWNTQGRAPYVMFSDGQRTLAHPTYPTIKLGTWWLLAKEAYGPANNADVTSPSGYDQVWLGSVMEDQQDASGLLYRRNRYYDPASGRFTQEDPIGLAGGLNAYGFANGDPVSYSDPYGLRPCHDAKGNVIPCPEPPGGPPYPLPPGRNQPAGKPNRWKATPGSGRGTKWVPVYPVPTRDGRQPGASWERTGVVQWGSSIRGSAKMTRKR